MAELTCPGCQATFELEGQETTLPESCPFCGAELGDLISQWSASAPRRESPSQAPVGRPTSTALPTGSSIVMFTPEPGQLLFQIPPGKSGAANFLLFFAILWNAIVMIVASGFLLGGQQNQGASLWFLIPFFSLFVFVGLLVLVIGVSMKYTRTMLLLEAHRAVMQKTILKYESFRETPLAAGAHATLVESYRQNNRPVYAVSIVSGSDSLKFGTSLTDAEKDALIKLINHHLWCEIHETAADVKEGLAQETIAATEMSPHELSPGTMIDVIENRPDELVISFPLVPSPTFKMAMKLVLAFTGVFATGMAVFVAVMVANVGARQNVPLVFLIPFGLMFLVPFLIVLSVSRLRVSIGINGEQVVHQIAGGPFRRKKTWDSLTATGVSIRSHVIRSDMRGDRRRRGSATTLWSYCTLDCADQTHWLAFGPKHPFCREVAGLVRYQLSQVGVTLHDPPIPDSSRESETPNAGD